MFFAKTRIFIGLLLFTVLLTGCQTRNETHQAGIKILQKWEDTRSTNISPPLLQKNGVVVIQETQTWKTLWTFSFRDPISGDTETISEAPEINFETYTALVCYHFDSDMELKLLRVEHRYDTVTMRFVKHEIEEAAVDDSGWYDVTIVVIEKLPLKTTVKTTIE